MGNGSLRAMRVDVLLGIGPSLTNARLSEARVDSEDEYYSTGETRKRSGAVTHVTKGKSVSFDCEGKGRTCEK